MKVAVQWRLWSLVDVVLVEQDKFLFYQLIWHLFVAIFILFGQILYNVPDH